MHFDLQFSSSGTSILINMTACGACFAAAAAATVKQAVREKLLENEKQKSTEKIKYSVTSRGIKE
jgi:uncharacterized protein (DUF2062 family)